MNRNVKIPDKKKYLLFTELHSLLASGLSFSRSFDLLAQNEKKDVDRKRLEELYGGIVQGNPLWRSMESSGHFTMLDMLSSIIGFYPYSRSFAYIRNGLERGEPFSDNIARFGNIYDRKLITLMKVGEETNSLDKMLYSQAEDITAELEHGLKQLGSILEPVLILFIGAIVAFVLIAMYMPMFRLGQAFG